MWVNPTIFHRTKSIAKKYREKINIDTFQLRKAFSTRQNLLKKIFRKYKYWHNQL